jgi:predicted metal-dependent hydrolase
METRKSNKPEWPPKYTIKKSRRARYVKLKASVHYGLEVVVPTRFNQKHLPEILETNKIWILKQLEKIEAELQELNDAGLPEEISLPIAHHVWKVFYVHTDNKKLQLLARPGQELVLLGNVSNRKMCETLLLSWVKKQAQVHLPKLLDEVSDEVDLPYSRLSIRSQRSRWGSCTQAKAINLNYKLMFLPAYLVKHIMIHELCHTRHMNHSTRFWRLVASFDDAWEKNSRETRRADKFIPTWAVNIF